VLVVTKLNARSFVVQSDKYLFMEKSSKELDDWLFSVIDEWTDWKASRQTHRQMPVVSQSVIICFWYFYS